MLRRFIPQSLAQGFRDAVYRIAGRMYFESHPGESSYCVPGQVRSRNLAQASELPVPPQSMWLGYGNTVKEYLQSGSRDVSTMLQILKQAAFQVQPGQKILEFGCCTGRMIRHLVNSCSDLQLWGADLHAGYIQWDRQNLSPDIHFALCTAIPHLPFPDQMFDLIFCGSVFTHIDEFDGSWLLELARIIRPGGFLYFTIHDEHTAMLLKTSLRDSSFATRMNADPVYEANCDDFSLICVGRKDQAQVFHHSEYLQALLPPMLQWESLTHEAYGLQSGVLLKKV
jgi:ubiquinone/menaquinone biosynthesis C-methylase UbiE